MSQFSLINKIICKQIMLVITIKRKTLGKIILAFFDFRVKPSEPKSKVDFKRIKTLKLNVV